jgi:hypothetical protein
MHHIASDGWSTGILVRELSELYAAGREGRTPALAALPAQYGDVTDWQSGRLAGARGDGEIEYWRGVLAGAPATSTPTPDRPRPPTPTGRGATFQFT